MKMISIMAVLLLFFNVTMQCAQVVDQHNQFDENYDAFDIADNLTLLI